MSATSLRRTGADGLASRTAASCRSQALPRTSSGQTAPAAGLVCSRREPPARRLRPPVWFALDENRPLAFFAGIWTRWTSVRKVKVGETTNNLFAFLTTQPNAIVAPVHAKAMPVILMTQKEVDLWMTAPAKDALTLQRPLPDDALRIVARGQKQDGPEDQLLVS